MKSWKRLVFFVILNIFVSACTTVVVLILWDQYSNSTTVDSLSGLNIPLIRSSSPTSTRALVLEPSPTPAFMAYKVQAGDDFASIAARYGISVETLLTLNGFSQEQPLGAGEVLLIPLSPTPVAVGTVLIKSIVGAGTLESENVLIEYRGDGELPMAGWRLEDQNGNLFIFPETAQLTLFKDGAVTVWSKPGKNTVLELFWGRDQAVWQSGETAVLRDSLGVVQALYLIP